MVPLFSATLSNLLPSRAISCDDGFEGKFNVALDEPGYHYSLGGRHSSLGVAALWRIFRPCV